jgi:acetyltransferase-like isoleucine patch superfamily enzyme
VPNREDVAQTTVTGIRWTVNALLLDWHCALHIIEPIVNPPSNLAPDAAVARDLSRESEGYGGRKKSRMKVIGCISITCYRAWQRVTGKLFSLLIAGGFARFGRHTTIMYPLRLCGEEKISIGNRVTIGAGSWLQALPCDSGSSQTITIGDGTSIQEFCVVSAVRGVVLEDSVLLARNVYISDHIHAYTRAGAPILSQGVDKVKPVRIKSGAWLGQNVVVCPGVTIGRGAVVGANSVVTEDLPDFSVSVGAPARVVKCFTVATR